MSDESKDDEEKPAVKDPCPNCNASWAAHSEDQKVYCAEAVN